MTPDMNASIVEHVVSKWGEPTRRAEFHGMGNHISILKWSAEQTDEGVALYLTIGGSRRLIDAGNRRRFEFLLGIVPEEDNVAQSLAMLAGALLSGINLDKGHTLSLAENLWDGSGFSGYLILPDIDPIIDQFLLDDGSHVEFLPVMPVYRSEIELKGERSGEWLLDAFERHEVPWWDPGRAALEIATGSR
ncbi:hypothetical protein ABIA32_006601 [Streptacidiphilus sp. MAP12-20]|uniref:suppressor of fused domain protein n=1 Tax=Streptacidiphilus sp. MAP12-20 TaxID=3156299 RepID=UPI0035199B32